MAAGDMADFMGKHPHNLLGPFRRHKQPAGEEYSLSPRHECVKGPIVDDMQTDIVRIKAGSPQKWRSISSRMVYSISASRIPAPSAGLSASANCSSRIATTAPMAAKEDIALRTGDTFSRSSISRWRFRVRQSIVAGAVGLSLAACGSDDPREGQVGFVSSDFGGVVSDEPRSALIGRDILSAGGAAIDAAVATYFALAVTYPGAASLGGGTCVSSSAVGARPLRQSISGHGYLKRTTKPAMIPGAVRGMFALHARYGRLQWEAFLLPAERLARFGNPVSRAFAQRLAAVPLPALTDPTLQSLFAPAGKMTKEGDILTQFELSATLARIRLRARVIFTPAISQKFWPRVLVLPPGLTSR